jgi:SAM-dependent methyltransferase
MTSRSCSVCGNSSFAMNKVLWPALVNEWQLTPYEADYIDRQQGECCTHCGSNLRSIALASAIVEAAGARDTLLSFCVGPDAAKFNTLELNEAGTLHGALSRMPHYVFGSYPEVDMHDLPYPDDTFDLVVHSDTLEHLGNPIRALAECRRVLRKGGALCFTAPIIVNRLSRSRTGLPPSYHGAPGTSPSDYVVHTEFGVDA